MQQGWIRILVASIGGIVVAGLCIMLVEIVAHRQLSGEGVFGGAIVGLFIGALVGGFSAVRIARRPRMAWIVVGALFLLSMVNVSSFAHPAWFVPSAIAALIVGGWIATRATVTRERNL